MPAKPTTRNWNDVQTAIATVSIVTTLGLWNLFSTPAKSVVAQGNESELPPTEIPVDEQPVPTEIPQVKIMFTQVAPQQQTTVVQQTQQTKKNKNKNKNKNNGGGGTVTQTQTS